MTIRNLAQRIARLNAELPPAPVPQEVTIISVDDGRQVERTTCVPAGRDPRDGGGIRERAVEWDEATGEATRWELVEGGEHHG